MMGPRNVSLTYGSANTVYAYDNFTGSTVAFDPESRTATVAGGTPGNTFSFTPDAAQEVAILNYIRETNDANSWEQILSNASLVPECSGQNWTGCQMRAPVPLAADEDVPVPAAAASCGERCDVRIRVISSTPVSRFSSSQPSAVTPLSPLKPLPPLAGLGRGTFASTSGYVPDCNSVG